MPDKLTVGKTDYSLGDYKKIAKDLGRELTDTEKSVLTGWTNGNVQFADQKEFDVELTRAGGDWDSQKVFYSADNLKNTTATSLKLYSARSEEDASALYAWAKTNGITLSGKAFAMPKEVPTAPFAGHFGDRAHTIKHWRQKTSGGKKACLLIIKISEAGVKDMKAATPSKGGEGKSKGGFGLKYEKGALSVAVGANNETWEWFKKSKIITSIEILDRV